MRWTRRSGGIAMLTLMLMLGAGTASSLAQGGTADWTVGMTWEIQLSSPPGTLKDVDVYDVDLFDTPKALLDDMESQGIQTICYFSAGSYEQWRDDADQLANFRGDPLKGWPGEWWIDIRRSEVRDVMEARLDFARNQGCDAVDPDNVDGYANKNGLGLTKADQIDYLKFLSREARERGMAVGLKNAVELVPDLVGDFDFSVNEECFDYNECGTLKPFIDAGKPVFQIQYGGKKEVKRICNKANARQFSTLVKTYDLNARGVACWNRRGR
jgi:hypothetical protein